MTACSIGSRGPALKPAGQWDLQSGEENTNMVSCSPLDSISKRCCGPAGWTDRHRRRSRPTRSGPGRPASRGSMSAWRGVAVRGDLAESSDRLPSGRSSLLIASLAAATFRGDVAALVDTHDTFDAGSALAAGLSLEHLLWARGAPAVVARPHVLLNRAIKAFGLVLEAGGFGIVALNLGDVAPVDLARLPFTTWRRLQRFVEGRDTIALVLAPVPVARSARGVTLELSASASTATWAGESRRARRLTGLSLVAAQVRTARRMWRGWCSVHSLPP